MEWLPQRTRKRKEGRKTAISQPLSPPWGRYCYITLPQGYISLGNGYSRRFDEIVSEFPNKIKMIDDALLWSDTASSFFQACRWLDTCGKNGITQNTSIFVFRKDTVEFLGFKITPDDNLQPSPTMLRAISEFPTPKNLTDVRSWFGLVNQVAYAFSMTDKMLPFRELLKPITTFYWDDNLQRLFKESKTKILVGIEHGVRIFDKIKPTCLELEEETWQR